VSTGDEESVSVPGLGDDFAELPDGTLAAIVTEEREVDSVTIDGNAIVEVDESGEVTSVWSTWDCFDPVAVPGDDPDNGWTQANALAYNLGQDAYYVGLRGLSAIAKVPRGGTECEWVLGGPSATIPFADESTPFAQQSHFQVRVLVETVEVLVIDAGSAPEQLRLLEYALDLDGGLATEVSSTTFGDSAAEPPRGSVTRLDDRGTTFVNWAAAGRMELLSDGEVSWSVQTSADYRFGFHALVPSLYP
jgi:hypothetical protein